MKPFDTVTVTITKDDIDYTYGSTIICTYTDADGVVYMKQSDVEAI